MKTLHIAPGISIPAEEFIESATALIGKRGSGKSGGVKVLEEELFKVNLPFITLDPVGVHWGIRASADGKSPGLPVLVIGGEHGDLKLDRRAGAEIARAVIEANISCVIDLSEEPKAAWRQFVRDFCREVYKINRSPRIIILEEAPEFVPQRIPSDTWDTYEAVERLVARGRNKALGVVLVGQRAATINKDVLTQVDNLFVGRLVGKQDRKALGEWVEAWDVNDRLPEFEAALASLPTRTMYLWSPERLKKFQPMRFKDFQTLHGDMTHLRKLGLLEARPVTTDVSSVVAKLGKEMEKFKAEKIDQAEVPRLRETIKRLEARARSQGEQQNAIKDQNLIAPLKEENASLHEKVQKMRAEIDSANARIRHLAEARKDVLALAKRVGSFHESTSQSLVLIAGKIGAVGIEEHLHVHLATAADKPGAVSMNGPQPSSRPILSAARVAPASRVEVRQSRGAIRRDLPDIETGWDKEPIHLKKGAVRMLGELSSRHPLTVTRAQLATLVGMTASGGTYTTYLSTLKRAGLLDEDGRGDIHVTPEGLDFIGEVPPAPSTHDEIMARWRQSLKSGNARMLDEVASVYPDPIDKITLAERLDMEPTGGTYSTYLSILRRNNLVVMERDGIRASDALFPEGLR